MCLFCSVLIEGKSTESRNTFVCFDCFLDGAVCIIFLWYVYKDAISSKLLDILPVFKSLILFIVCKSVFSLTSLPILVLLLNLLHNRIAS